MRAQITTQTFVFIFALLVGAGVLILGYQAINLLLAQGQQNSVNAFMEDISDDISRYRDFGSRSEPITYRLPSAMKRFCIFDNTYDANNQHCQSNRLECSAWESGASTFSIPQVQAELESVSVIGGVICVSAGQRLELVYEGLGDATKISGR